MYTYTRIHTHVYTYMHHVGKIIGSSCNPVPSPWQPSCSLQFVTLPGGLQTAPGVLCPLKCKASTGEAGASPSTEGHATLKGQLLPSSPKWLFLFCSFYWGQGGSTSGHRREGKEKKGHCLHPGPLLPCCWKEKSQMHGHNRNKQYIVSQSKTAVNVIA